MLLVYNIHFKCGWSNLNNFFYWILWKHVQLETQQYMNINEIYLFKKLKNCLYLIYKLYIYLIQLLYHIVSNKTISVVVVTCYLLVIYNIYIYIL